MAGVWGAFVHLLLTVTSSVSSLAVAVVDVSCVQTLTRVTTQMGNIDSYAERMRHWALVLFFENVI